MPVAKPATQDPMAEMIQVRMPRAVCELLSDIATDAARSSKSLGERQRLRTLAAELATMAYGLPAYVAPAAPEALVEPVAASEPEPQASPNVTRFPVAAENLSEPVET